AVATSGPSGGFLPSQVPIVAPEKLDSSLRRAVSELREDFQRKLFDAFVADAVRPGGLPAKTFDIRRLPLDLGFFRVLKFIAGVEVDLMLGAGLVVYDNTRDMLAEARNCTQFYRNESCGKCVP